MFDAVVSVKGNNNPVKSIKRHFTIAKGLLVMVGV